VNYNNVHDILLLLKMSRRTLIVLLDKGSVRKLICMHGWWKFSKPVIFLVYDSQSLCFIIVIWLM
jgi:1,4-dihydroxy-2-naphthoate octaprenyltransferase